MELVDFSRFFLALAAVVGMIWLVAYLLKRFGIDKRLRGVTGDKGRLAVVDVLYLDPRRRLTIVRADSREYLLFITADGAQVIDKLEGKTHDQTA